MKDNIRRLKEEIEKLEEELEIPEENLSWSEEIQFWNLRNYYLTEKEERHSKYKAVRMNSEIIPLRKRDDNSQIDSSQTNGKGELKWSPTLKLKISGRLRGINMARSFAMSSKKGGLKPQTVQSIIEYSQNNIKTKWGILGLSVTLC